MSRIIRSYIVDIVETDDVIYCDKDGHLTYNIEEDKNELVRCKDCRWYEDPYRKIFENCVRGGRTIPMQPTDFCSYGARRE